MSRSGRFTSTYQRHQRSDLRAQQGIGHDQPIPPGDYRCPTCGGPVHVTGDGYVVHDGPVTADRHGQIHRLGYQAPPPVDERTRRRARAHIRELRGLDPHTEVPRAELARHLETCGRCTRYATPQ
jgi:hypothetical protein